jgi:16S rRNA (adenine1518-N6/adenine1519-N6)-dimethyltransferase
VDALTLESGERVIEIGPGQGALTELLVANGAQVTAIEFDRDLAPALRKRFAGVDDFSVIEADALDIDLKALARSGSKLVANLPYNISTPILQRLVAQRDVFSTLVLMFQREVVERIVAEPGVKERGFLSVIAQNAFEIEYLFDVPPAAFWPVPKVWSAVIRLSPKPKRASEDKLREVVSTGFAQKRKTLANNLKGLYPHPAALLRDVGLAEKCRAEELSLADWTSLVDRLGRERGE